MNEEREPSHALYPTDMVEHDLRRKRAFEGRVTRFVRRNQDTLRTALRSNEAIERAEQWHVPRERYLHMVDDVLTMSPRARRRIKLRYAHDTSNEMEIRRSILNFIEQSVREPDTLT